MATIAVIQSLFPTLNTRNSKGLSGLSKQVYEKFFEVLVEESGHVVQRATSLEDYQAKGHEKPDIVICAPLPEIGNIAPGLVELQRFRDAFPDTPVIVWSNREESAIRKAVLQDYGAVAFYDGNLLNAPDDIADMVLKYTRR